MNDLDSFRRQRASFEISKVGMFITDAAIRKHFTDDLKNIFSFSDNRRTVALDDLMTTITTSSTTRDEIYKALKFLTDKSGYNGNPFLLIAMAATTCSRSNTSIVRYPEVTEVVIAAAVKATNERLYNNPKNSASTIITQEAARINLWAATLYDNINATDSAAHRRRIERLLSMSDVERGSLQQGDEIGVFDTRENVIRPIPPSSQQIHNLNKEWKDRQQMEQDINQITNEIPPTDPYYDDYYYKPSDRVEIRDRLVKQKRRVMAYGQKRATLKSVSLSQPLNKVGTSEDYLGNPVTLLLEEWRYLAADRRMAELASYSEKRRRLLKQIRNEEIIVIPPRPEVIKQMIADVRRYGRNFHQPFMKFGIFYTLTDLEKVLEESDAFYKVRK